MVRPGRGKWVRELELPMDETFRQQVLDETLDWLDKAVIGLNLCPFAKSVQVNQRMRYVVSQADNPEALLKELAHELLALRRAAVCCRAAWTTVPYAFSGTSAAIARLFCETA